LVDEGGIFPESRNIDMITGLHDNGFVAAAITAFD